MSCPNFISLTKILPCLAEPGKIIVVGKPDQSLAQVIPYLAALPGVIAYNPDTLTLTFRRPRGFMTLYPEKVYITQLRDAEEGLQLLSALAEAVKATWEAFACSLLKQERELEECPPIHKEEQWAGQLETLRSLLV
jgi:ArsR family metal-binding transcriptional regulator